MVDIAYTHLSALCLPHDPFLRYMIFIFSSNNTIVFISNFKVTAFSSCLAVEISRGVHFTLAEN